MEKNSLSYFFPAEIALELSAMPLPLGDVREIRLRAGAPLVVVGKKTYVGEKIIDGMTVERTAQRMCLNSVYAKQEELKNGFVTLPGGHRAGFCGRAVMENGHVRALTDISSINLRIAHEIPGAADKILPALVSGNDIHNTLIVSPPGCGKTTILRDIARQLGSRIYGFRVGIADERGEIAAMHRGTAQCDIGIFTDVYDGFPKKDAMQMLLRGMAPKVVITDELGGEEDEEAVRALTHRGVRVICSLHGTGREDALSRPGIGALLRQGIFKKVVTLGGVGKILSIE
ncbi:MAG: stage III sporulation protein AA [Clostridia bacterium]|nr:stage III sporulation protein AA [Clostridia bacterium]